MGPIWMTLLLLVGWGVFLYSAWRRWSLMQIGKKLNSWTLDLPKRLKKTFVFGLMQKRMPRYFLAGMAHRFIFVGFVVLLLRTLILWGRGYDETFHFWIFGSHQPLGQIYNFLKDLFALLVIGGSLVFVYYRVVKQLKRMTLSIEGLVILGIIIIMMVADILYDGASLALAATAPMQFIPHEPLGSMVAMKLNGVSPQVLLPLKHMGFWTHSGLVLLFLNLLPYSKHFHVITAIPNIFFSSLDAPGRLPPIEDIEGKLERGETLGIKRIDQFSWKSVLDFYTCTECGRCTDQCPAANTGKKLSPKHFNIDLRNFLYKNERDLLAANQTAGMPVADAKPLAFTQDLAGPVIHPEVLWACTTCRACEVECPVFISFVDKIIDMRRYLVQEKGEFPKELQTAFQGMERSGNPWGFSAEDRMKWAEGLGVKTLAENTSADVVFWVGCAAAFDERAKKIARATVQLLQKAQVNFAVLGQSEMCTGDPARRAGNEYLFQFLAKANVENLNGAGADKKKILATCPHCFNTLRNEYKDFGGVYDVVHHSEYLNELVKSGRLKPTKPLEKTITYHDSCYLGRYNEVYDAPREALKSIPGVILVEPEETRDRGMCCGAGGAQMFKEEEPGKERVNDVRTAQLLRTKPDAIASGCPFCMRMLTDGLANKKRQEDVAQLDVAELLWNSVNEPVMQS